MVELTGHQPAQGPASHVIAQAPASSQSKGSYSDSLHRHDLEDRGHMAEAAREKTLDILKQSRLFLGNTQVILALKLSARHAYRELRSLVPDTSKSN